MPGDYELYTMIAACGGMLLICGFLIWMRENRYYRLAGRNDRGSVRGWHYDLIGLAAIVLTTGLHILLGGWPADFSVPFAWHTYLMWAGWLAGPGILTWNHWDDPSFWRHGSSKGRWWL